MSSLALPRRAVPSPATPSPALPQVPFLRQFSSWDKGASHDKGVSAKHSA
jgi:hypothetical protein